MLLAAYAVFRFRDSRGTVQKAFTEDLPAVETLAEKFHWNIANSSTIATIQRIIQTDTNTLAWVSVGLLVYGILQLIEATGLWLLKRWGEYFAAVATSLFIPLEVYEITEKVTWIRIGALLINIGAVVYLRVHQAPVRAAWRHSGLRGRAARGEPSRGRGGGDEPRSARSRRRRRRPPAMTHTA